MFVSVHILGGLIAALLLWAWLALNLRRQLRVAKELQRCRELHFERMGTTLCVWQRSVRNHQKALAACEGCCEGLQEVLEREQQAHAATRSRQAELETVVGELEKQNNALIARSATKAIHA